jgi:hypothetical protein
MRLGLLGLPVKGAGWRRGQLVGGGLFEGDDPDIAVAEAVAAAVAGQDAGTGAFSTAEREVDVLGVGGGRSSSSRKTLAS